MQSETKELLDKLNNLMPNWREIDALPTPEPIREVLISFREFTGRDHWRRYE